MLRTIMIVAFLLAFTGCDLLPRDIRIQTPDQVHLDLNALQGVLADSSMRQLTLVDVPIGMGAIEASISFS